MATWNVGEHGALEKLEPNLWTVEAAVPNLPLRRRMTLVRLGDGSVVVHSAVCLAEALQREIDAWGTVRFVFVPNGWHRLDARAYAERYPDARVVCPDGARKLVAKKVRVDGNPSLVPADSTLALEKLRGSRIEEHALVVRSGERVSLVFGDTVFNLPKLSGFHGWVYGAIGSTGAPKVTPLMRLVSVNDRSALRAQLETLTATPSLYRVIPGHGTVVEGASDATAMMHAVCAGLA
jgi:hypothetical protein